MQRWRSLKSLICGRKETSKMATLPRKGGKRFSPHDQLGHDDKPAAVKLMKLCFDSRPPLINISHVNARSVRSCRKKMPSHHSKQRSSSSSPTARFFRSVGASMVEAMRRLFTKKMSSSSCRSDHISEKDQVIPFSTLGGFVPHRESHHSEAMEDCIEFVNSSYRKSLS